MASPTFMALMPEIVSWLTANGLDHNAVPIEEWPIVTSTTIVTSTYGTPIEVDHHGPIAHVQALPLVTPPPARIIPWLLGEIRP